MSNTIVSGGVRKRSGSVFEPYSMVCTSVATAVPSSGDMVTLDGNGKIRHALDVCITGIMGIALEAGVASEEILISPFPRVWLKNATAMSAGDLAYAASENTIDAGSSGDIPIGIVITGGVNNAQSEVQVWSYQYMPIVSITAKGSTAVFTKA